MPAFLFECDYLLRGSSFFLLCPAPLYSFGDTLPPFWREVSFLLHNLLGCGGHRFLGLCGAGSTEQGASPLQLGNLMVNLCKYFGNSHDPSSYIFIGGLMPAAPMLPTADGLALILS
ncbi:MAG: hypothetical protein WCA11_07705 [Terracidiphilus sp.]